MRRKTLTHRTAPIKLAVFQVAAAVRFAAKEYDHLVTRAGNDFLEEFADRIEVEGIEELFT